MKIMKVKKKRFDRSIKSTGIDNYIFPHSSRNYYVNLDEEKHVQSLNAEAVLGSKTLIK